MKGLSALLLGLTIATLTGEPVRAQSALTDSLHQLETVYVTRRLAAQSPLPLQVLSGRELQKLNALSVADALRYFTGLQIKDYGGIGGLKTVNVRSLGAQHVGVFYDGLAISNSQNGQVDLGRFSLDNIEAVSLYNGQKGSTLQAAKDYASSSAVYLTSRAPQVTSERRRSIKLGASIGSFDTYSPSVLWEQYLSPKLSLSLSTALLSTSGRYRFTYRREGGYSVTDTRHNGDVLSWRGELGLFGKLNEGEWKVRGYSYLSKRGYPGAAVRQGSSNFRNEDRQWDRNYFVQGSLRKAFGDRYSLLVQGKYAYDWLHYNSDPRRDQTTLYVDNIYRLYSTYLSAAHEVRITDDWRIGLSNDLEWDQMEANLEGGFPRPERWMLLSALSTSFTRGDWRLEGSLLHTWQRDYLRAEKSWLPKRSIVSPTLVASYKPRWASGLQLRAMYKSIFRLPTFNDLYYTLIGSRTLKPEDTKQYDLGVTYGRSRPGNWLRELELTGDVYYNEVKDKIIAMPGSNQFQWTMLNFGLVHIFGTDLSAQATAQLNQVTLRSRLGYTYQRAKDVTTPGDLYYGGQIPYIPRHSGSAVLGAQWRGFGLNYSFVYTGVRYDSYANLLVNRMVPWYTHDLSLSYDTSLRARPLALTLEINNLLNQQYEVVRSYPMPGINFKLKAQWTI